MLKQVTVSSAVQESGCLHKKMTGNKTVMSSYTTLLAKQTCNMYL